MDEVIVEMLTWVLLPAFLTATTIFGLYIMYCEEKEEKDE